MAAGRLSCRARNGRSPGEESRTAAVAAQAIEAQPSSGQIKPKRGRGRAPNSSSGEVLANLTGPAQEDRYTGRRDGGHSVEKRRHRLTQLVGDNASSLYPVGSPKGRSIEVVMEGCVRPSRRGKRSPPRSSPTRSTRETQKHWRPWPCSRPSSGDQTLPVSRPSNGGTNSANGKKVVQRDGEAAKSDRLRPTRQSAPSSAQPTTGR